MLGDSSVYQKSHGVPSGSGFTQLVDSLINILVTRTLLSSQGIVADKDRYLGDDSYSYITTRQFNRIDMNLLINQAKMYFNLTLHKDKICIATGIDEAGFLGYEKQGKMLIRPTKQWMLRALYPENMIQTRCQSASRMYGLFMIGGCNDPIFSDFFKFFVKIFNVGKISFDPGKSFAAQLKYSGLKTMKVGDMIDLKKIC